MTDALRERCVRAVAEVPHAAKCYGEFAPRSKGFLALGVCRCDRDARIAAGLAAAIDAASSAGFQNVMNQMADEPRVDEDDLALQAFTKAAQG